jgi:hypothetical protein
MKPISNQALRIFAKTRGREYVPYCDFPENVLWGEYHGDKYDLDSQAEFVEILRPGIVLHEFMGINVYDPETKELSQRREESKNICPCNDDGRDVVNRYFIDLADEFGFLLVGCDLTPREREFLIQQRGGRYQGEDEIRARRDYMGLPINGLLGVNYLDLADPERHQEMASVYREHCGKTDGLLMMTGLHHVRSDHQPDWEESDLHDLLAPADYSVIENRENVRIPAFA